MPEQDAAAALKASIQAAKELGGLSRNQQNALVAKNILHEELGYFGTDHLLDYDLDSETKGRLLAHCRQDAAHGVVNTSTALDQLRSISRAITFFG
ncbi:MAG: hypothetical protein GEV13_05525 [Rhodospirillales bacterium]|nr:hypothetical protein [Rhodospirillales bacterium]